MQRLAIVAALLAACTASDVDVGPDAAPLVDPAIPSDVAAVLEEHCLDCHGDPQANDAPMRLSQCSDWFELAPISSGGVWQAARYRIRANEGDYVMPPDGPMPDEDVAVLDGWLFEYMPGCEREDG